MSNASKHDDIIKKLGQHNIFLIQKVKHEFYMNFIK